MRYEVRPCVGEKVKYYIVRYKWWWTEELYFNYLSQRSKDYSFSPESHGIAYFDTPKEAEKKAIELFGTTARIDVKSVNL